MYMMYNSQQVCRASIDISTPNDKRVVSTAFQFSSNNYCQTVGTRLGRNAHDAIIAFDVYCNDRTPSKAYNCVQHDTHSVHCTSYNQYEI